MKQLAVAPVKLLIVAIIFVPLIIWAVNSRTGAGVLIGISAIGYLSLWKRRRH